MGQRKTSAAPSSWGRQTFSSALSSIAPSTSSSSRASSTYGPSSRSRARSTTSSFRTSHSDSSSHTSYSQHPYAAMAPAPLPVVSSHDATEDEEECPVCLEPLSFSFRLPGEKPHIVPECGHALHEACFTAVYGPPPGARGAGPRKTNLGVCGVCRRPMKVGDGDSGKSNKLAALTGMGDRNAPALYPGRNSDSRGPVAGPSRHTNNSTPAPYDPHEDDPIDQSPSVKSDPSTNPNANYIVAPSIQVRSEFETITRTTAQTQPLTCIVVIELPSRRNSGHVPGPVLTHDSYRSPHISPVSPQPQQPHYSGRSSPQRGEHQHQHQHSHSHREEREADREPSGPPTNFAYNPTPPAESSPFSSITEDLRNRIYDWKGHPLNGLGPLQMFDILSVRRDSLVREFYVYLFKEAIICVLEEKKKSFGRLLSSASGATGAFGDNGSVAGGKGVLRLKGRIYIRHIKRVIETSVANELSLTIDMEDERLESFILIFRDRSSLESWRTNISNLVSMFQNSTANRSVTMDMEEFGSPRGIPDKAARMLSGSSSETNSTNVDSLLTGGSRATTMSSNTSGVPSSRYGGTRLQKIPSEEHIHFQPNAGLVTPHMSAGPSNSLTPLPHSPMDLILVISLPPPNAVPSTAALKIRVIKTTLDFVLASLGTRDRLSLVTFEVGVGGRVRKTPFLSLGRTQGRARLQKFIDTIGGSREDTQNDEFTPRTGNEDKTDVVTAVNHGLDVVLQRKSRNGISGMLLVSDAADSTRRAQMDLVLARAEAANVPIHTFGYGRSHDPASLWLMSNHTNGTYTFVKDWYDLQQCLAGCIGGMMSIGLLNMKLHMKIVDSHRFRIRKVSGGPNAILSSDGRDVDIEVGELRYGEKKEMLVELELDNSHDASMGMSSRTHSTHLDDYGSTTSRTPNATDQFAQRMGLDYGGDSPNLVDGMMERMIDEVPVFEVDGSFFDPAAGKNVSRLAHPVLLTVTLLPMAGNRPSTPGSQSDPVLLRRRMELLASDMITRALVLASRKNYGPALKIMSETKRSLLKVLEMVGQSLPAPNAHGGTIRTRKEILALAAVRALQSIIQDIQILADALEDNVELFAHDHRNYGAQQAMILRDQKSWTGRTATEKLFWTADNSIELVSRSTDWLPRE